MRFAGDAAEAERPQNITWTPAAAAFFEASAEETLAR
jgi:hypothetical protein